MSKPKKVDTEQPVHDALQQTVQDAADQTAQGQVEKVQGAAEQSSDDAPADESKRDEITEEESDESEDDDDDDRMFAAQIGPAERIDLLAEPRPDPMDASAVLRPPCVVPEKFLPKWYRTPLFSKIPAKSDPANPVTFTRPKLGKSLYLTFENKDFDSKPLYDLPMEYNSLHDPHLRRYYMHNVKNYINLIKNKKITPHNDYVVCSQADFNTYRAYVRSIMLKEENNRRTAEEREIERLRAERQRALLGDDERHIKELVKQVLRKRKFYNIAMLRCLDEDERIRIIEKYCDDEDEESDVERDELAQIREEEEQRRLATIKEKFEKNLARVIRLDEKRENQIKEKIQKASQMWENMAADEKKHMERLHRLRKNYDARFKINVDKREERYKKIRDADRARLETRKKGRRTPGKLEEERKNGAKHWRK